MQGWKPLEPLEAPAFPKDTTACKGTFRYQDELARDSVFDGLETTTSLGDLDLIGQLFPPPSSNSSQEFVSVPQPAPSSAQPAGPSGLPHSSSSGSSELPGQSPDPGSDHGPDAEKADTKTAQAGIAMRVQAILSFVACLQSCLIAQTANIPPPCPCLLHIVLASCSGTFWLI